MSMKEEIRILEVSSGDYNIELTSSKLKIKSGPLQDPFIKLFRFTDFYKTPFKRSILWTVNIEEIPVKNIKSISIERDKLKITWTKEENKRMKQNETKIRLKPYQAKILKEAILKLIKGEDPLKLATEYSKYALGYFKVIEDEKCIIIVRESTIEIQDPEIYKIAYGRIPLIAPTPAIMQATRLYAEKIPLDEISKLELAKRPSRDGAYIVEFKLRSGREKKVKFKSKSKAEELLEVVNRIIEARKAIRRIAGEERTPIPGRSLQPTDEWKRKIFEDAASFLALFMIIYIMLTELVAKSLLTMLLSIAAALAATVILKRIRGD